MSSSTLGEDNRETRDSVGSGKKFEFPKSGVLSSDPTTLGFLAKRVHGSSGGPLPNLLKQFQSGLRTQAS